MKTVKIINSLDFGGIEKVFEIVAKYYPGNKSDLVFIALGTGGQAEKAIRARGYQVIVLGQPTKIPNFRIVLQLIRLLREINPDVVHTCGAEGNFHGLIAAWWCRVKVRVGEEIGMPGHSETAKRIFRIIYARTSAVIVVATSVREYLVKNREVPSSKCELVYNPVDLERYSQVKPMTSRSDFVLLTVCRLHPIKNLERLIRVVDRLIKDGFSLKLEMVGDGPSRPDLEKLVAELNLSNYVVFHGFQSDPSGFFARASAFILPSLSEGHPVSLVEAMVCSVPAIVTKVGGASEIIKDGESGWLVDPLNEDSIYAAIHTQLHLEPSVRDRVTATAKKIALENFSPAHYFDQLQNIYNRLNEQSR